MSIKSSELRELVDKLAVGMSLTADDEYSTRPDSTLWEAVEAVERLIAIYKTSGDEDPIALIEAAKSLPLTADGVRHNGIDALWGWIEKHDETPGEIHRQCWGTRREWEVARCYSTRAAAEAARGKEGV